MAEYKYDIKKMKPYGNNVILKLSDRVEKSKGGIVLPQNMKLSVWHSGTIVKIGPGKIDARGNRIPTQLTVGKKGVFRAFDDKWEILEGIDDEKYVILPEESIEFCMNGDPNGGE